MEKAIKILIQKRMEATKKRFPDCPYPATPRFSDKSANGLTKCILEFLRLSGHQAERVSVTGRWIDQRKTYTDVLGHRKTIGSGKWIKPSMEVGTADISATIQGKSVKIEVKVGRDRQRSHQKKYQESIEAAGGIYYIAKDFQQFFDWYIATFANSSMH